MGILKRKTIAKKIKNFLTCNNFFQSLVKAYVIALAMNTAGRTTIDFFCIKLLQLNWPDFINNIESLYSLFVVGLIYAKAKQNIQKVVEILLATKKVE